MKQICKVTILFLAINLHGEYREVVIIHDFRVEILQEKGVHSDCEEGMRRQLDFIKLVIPERVFQRLSETVYFKCGKHGCARVVQGHPVLVTVQVATTRHPRPTSRLKKVVSQTIT